MSSFFLWEKYWPGPGFCRKDALVYGAFILLRHISPLPVPLRKGFSWLFMLDSSVEAARALPIVLLSPCFTILES